MAFFDFINDILYKKNGDLLDKNGSEADFNPYMINRWISMHSNINLKILNISINKLYDSLENKKQWYKLFLTTIPKSKFKRFGYIKKNKKPIKKSDDGLEEAIDLLAKSHKLSKREIKMYIKEYDINVDSIKQIVKKGDIK